MTSVLKVDNIQNSSGTSAMSIDSSGNLTPAQKLLYGSNQPMFSVRGRSGNAQISGLSLSNTTDETSTTYINAWSITEVDRGNLLSGGRLVAPVDGLYEINALSGQTLGGAADYRALIVIKLDSAGTSGEEIYRTWTPNDYGWYTLAYHGFLDLTAGEQIAVGYHTSYAAHTNSTSQGATLFSAKLIG